MGGVGWDLFIFAERIAIINKLVFLSWGVPVERLIGEGSSWLEAIGELAKGKPQLFKAIVERSFLVVKPVFNVHLFVKDSDYFYRIISDSIKYEMGLNF